MKGIIEQIWDNTSKTGKPYKAIQIGGERYTLWDKKYFDVIQKGKTVDFDFNDKGKFKNITNVQLANNGNNNNGIQYPLDQKDLHIVRLSCLKTAAYLSNGFQPNLSLDEKSDVTLNVARKLESYVMNLDDEEPV